MLRALARFALLGLAALVIMWLAMTRTDDSFSEQCAKAYPGRPDRQAACLEDLNKPR